MRSMFGKSLLALSLFGALSASGAMADTVGFGVTGPLDAGSVNDPVSLGMEFTANASISIDALGFYSGSSSLTGSEDVGLFDSAGNLLTSVSVSTSDTLVSGYYFNSITPVALTSGDMYWVIAFVGDNGWNYGGTPTVPSDITYDRSGYEYGSSLTFIVGNYGTPYSGPNFEFEPTPAATPLPAALPLFAGGLGIIGFFGRRRKALAA